MFYSGFDGMPPDGLAIVPTPPVHLRALVEICPGPDAKESSHQIARALVAATGRQAITTMPGTGSAVFWLWRHLVKCAEMLLLEGADPFETDQALCKRGWDLGMFEAEDLIGLDRLLSSRRAAGDRACLVHDRMVQEGRLGRHASVGWYRYPGGGGAVVDPLMEDLIREEAYFDSVTPVARSADEVARALETDLIVAAKTLLSKGVLQSNADIEVILRFGFGVPVESLA